MTLILSLLLSSLLHATEIARQSPQPCAGLPTGKHALLERMAADFGLTCEQQLKIERLLHDEESVSKPLLRFTSFTADQRQAVMTKIKLAARRQIRPLLTPEQQKLLDLDMENVARAPRKGGQNFAQTGIGPGSPKTDALDDEEVLSRAVMNYAGLRAEEKKEIVLEIKRAARTDGNQRLTPEQQRKLDSDIAELSKR